MNLGSFIHQNLDRIGLLFERNCTADVTLASLESNGENHLYTACFIADDEAKGKTEEDVMQVYIEPMIVAIAQEISRMGIVSAGPLPFVQSDLGVVQFSLETKAPIRLTLQYEVAHWTGEYLYNEDGTPKMVTENEKLVHAKEYKAGTTITVDALSEQQEAVVG